MSSNGFTSTEIEELLRALKHRDRFSVNAWLSERTGRKLQWLDDVTFERWAASAEFWSFPDLAEDVKRVITNNS